MNKCDWPPGLDLPACPLTRDTRVYGAYLKAFPSPYGADTGTQLTLRVSSAMLGADEAVRAAVRAGAGRADIGHD